MKERIILAPGVSSSELLRALARFNVNTMGVRVVNAVELAGLVLMKSGKSVTEEFITHAEEPSVIYSFLKDIPYFRAASYADAENLARTLTQIRNLIPRNESINIDKALADAEFPAKNNALCRAYSDYISACSEAERIDDIMRIRRAIDELEHNEDIMENVEFLALSEYPLQPIESTLLKLASGGHYETIAIRELFGAERKSLDKVELTSAYGMINEIESMLDDIYSRNLPLDSCLIACADSSAYSQVFYDIAGQYGIPVTYGAGVPIMNSCPARLLKLLHIWNTNGYNGIDALRNILMSDSFDRLALTRLLKGNDETVSNREIEKLAKVAGALRISTDGEENRKKIRTLRESGETSQYLDWAEKLADEFAKGAAYFVDNYSVIRPETVGRIDKSAVNVISDTINAYMRYAADNNIDEIIPELLTKTVCSENSKEGMLHVTTIAAAIPAIRQNLYICGLSANNFPGSPTENYLMLDNDFRHFENEDNDRILPTSINRIRRNREYLDNLIGLAAALDVSVRLSYSNYSLSELKEQNPSSVLLSFKTIRKDAPYFTSRITANRLIGDEYSKGSEVEFSRFEATELSAKDALEIAWAPSALDIFLQCPRHFYLAKILRIPEEEPDNPFEILSAADIGTLAHSLMEYIANKEIDRDAFLAECEDAFDRALLARPPIHPANAAKEKKTFVRMMSSAFDMDPHNEILSAETEYSYEHPSGVRLRGYPDRVELLPTGSKLIVDFKTGRRVKHIENDFETCLQVIIYAWLCEQAGLDIAGCEYRYMRKGKSVWCSYDDEMKARLDEFLRYFRQCIETNTFERNEDKDTSCRYCRMKEICNWE